MKKILFLLIAASLLITSCSKDYLDVNNDPSKVTSSDPKLLLSSVIVNTAYNRGNEGSIFPSLFTNQLIGADRQPLATSNYTVSAGDMDNLWKYGFYTNSLKTSYDLMQAGISKSAPHYQALGNIMLAIGMTEATDIWGDIPYSEAFKGTTIINPKFDSQESIYSSMDALLDQAITLLSGANNGIKIDPSSE